MNSFAVLNRRTVLGLGLSALVAGPAWSAKPIKVTAEQAEAIDAISAYLNSFKTMQGEFTQISPKGNVSRGVFYISKPGKMRFEYAPPNPFLIVADGRWLTIKNRAKEKGDQFPLSQTPLKLVLSNKVDLRKETQVLDFEDQGGITSVTLEEKGGSLGGNLTLVYDRNRNALQQWVVTDAKGRRTTVSLENVVAGVKTDPALFVVKIKRKDYNSSKN
jgi:outer membrane lipoprotein-sorting protein